MNTDRIQSFGLLFSVFLIIIYLDTLNESCSFFKNVYGLADKLAETVFGLQICAIPGVHMLFKVSIFTLAIFKIFNFHLHLYTTYIRFKFFKNGLLTNLMWVPIFQQKHIFLYNHQIFADKATVDGNLDTFLSTAI